MEGLNTFRRASGWARENNRKNLRHFISGPDGNVMVMSCWKSSICMRKKRSTKKKLAKGHWVKWYNKCFCRLTLGSLRMPKHFSCDYHGMKCVDDLIVDFSSVKRENLWLEQHEIGWKFLVKRVEIKWSYLITSHPAGLGQASPYHPRSTFNDAEQLLSARVDDEEDKKEPLK